MAGPTTMDRKFIGRQGLGCEVLDSADLTAKTLSSSQGFGVRCVWVKTVIFSLFLFYFPPGIKLLSLLYYDSTSILTCSVVVALFHYIPFNAMTYV
jgi:hypothetical protein